MCVYVCVLIASCMKQYINTIILNGTILFSKESKFIKITSAKVYLKPI